MQTHIIVGTAMALFSGFALVATPIRGGEHETATPQLARKVIERGLTLLEKDTLKWRQERGCSTCHHGTMTIWALSEAKKQGYAVNGEALADITEWTKSRFIRRLDLPRDPREGWSLVSVPWIYLGAMSHNLPVLSREEVNIVARHLARHQEEDGGWVMPPPSNGAPPTWESRETLALLALLAWEPFVPADPEAAAAARTSREKAIEWLGKTEPTDTAQANTLRLLRDVRVGKPAEQLQPGIDQLLKRQNADGGWGQTKELGSDGYATGQALYALSFSGVKPDRPELQKAIAFLVATQRDDGSWPMTSRNHPGVESTRNPIRNPIPITYFGSAWAMLGLVRTVSSPSDTPAKQQDAFHEIKAFHGKYEVDENNAERPVVRVDLSFYEVSDQEVANFAKVLQAFPKLKELKFKSTKITDAGLAHLKALTQLEALSLQDTKVTDSGLEEFQKALPQVKVVR
jgi:hypothetical protein